MQIDLWPIERVKPYDRNPRQNDCAVDAVAASIREFGFRQPIVVDTDGVIVVGHPRWKAAQKLKLGQVPVHVAKDLTPEKAKAYRIADNATNELAQWDKQLLPLELADLQSVGFDLGLLGFGEDELAKYFQPLQEGQCDPDDIPAPPEKATTQPGDLWLLGDHRLLCGDSSKPEDVADNWKQSKKKSRERIDGIVALIMALDRASREEEFTSVYDKRGPLFITMSDE
jgi:ParB-like chromosome segregation protein Spo0J